MQFRSVPGLRKLPLCLVLGLLASGCSMADRLANIGETPKMSKIDDPTEKKDYKPVSLPMPKPEPLVRQANSLWRPGARQFFKDQRASKVGDILTVNVAVADTANVADTTTRSRNNAETAAIPNFLGAEAAGGALGRVFHGIDPANAVNLNSTSNSTGGGTVARSETINLTIAALVTQVLPNGNLVIYGRQEVRVNFEVRELTISGVVRPEDITATNTINHTQIAEARISYGGHGQLTDVQQARYGQQVFDVLFPF
jgi:flagellar L-ring protein precursor FlgH